MVFLRKEQDTIMKKWFLYQKKADFNGIGARYGISPILARILCNRDVQTEEQLHLYLEGTLEDCHDPALLPDIQKAVELLKEKIAAGKAIRVIGDYDVDGICSTYILVEALTRMGAKVDAAIPHRIKDGYGLNDNLIEEAHADGIDTILTCDNGIAAISQVELAKGFGMTVIVTDHHEVPFTEQEDGTRLYKMPSADAVVDPKREDNRYPFPGICGAVVAWKLVQLLCPEDSVFLREELLQVAALATVCDAMELKDENRIIVGEGLKRMNTAPIPGLRALVEAAGLQEKALSAYHLGFVIGPCLNATGRLDTAGRALELLQAKDRATAASLAQELRDLNESRKEMTKEGVEEAVELAQKQLEQTGKLDSVLVIYLPELHESLAGIVAGRIREKYTRPVFVLTDGQEEVKGSGRSIAGYDMYGEMTRCGDLFLKYGGHKMAAGLSIPREKVEEFRERMNRNCPLTEAELIDKVYIDVAMPFAYANEQLVGEFEKLEPFGNGNSKPLFAQKNVRVYQPRIFGRQRNVLKCRLVDGNGTERQGVYFGEVEEFMEFLESHGGAPISILYQPTINSYKGDSHIELVIEDYC